MTSVLGKLFGQKKRVPHFYYELNIFNKNGEFSSL